MKTPALTQWRREFPDYPPADMPAIPETWSDHSWHNDACPFFLITGALGVFVDFADPMQSEFPDQRIAGELCRFQIVAMDDGQHPVEPVESPLASDDWNEILARAAKETVPAAAKAESLDMEQSARRRGDI